MIVFSFFSNIVCSTQQIDFRTSFIFFIDHMDYTIQKFDELSDLKRCIRTNYFPLKHISTVIL